MPWPPPCSVDLALQVVASDFRARLRASLRKGGPQPSLQTACLTEDPMRARLLEWKAGASGWLRAQPTRGTARRLLRRSGLQLLRGREFARRVLRLLLWQTFSTTKQQGRRLGRARTCCRQTDVGSQGVAATQASRSGRMNRPADFGHAGMGSHLSHWNSKKAHPNDAGCAWRWGTSSSAAVVAPSDSIEDPRGWQGGATAQSLRDSVAIVMWGWDRGLAPHPIQQTSGLGWQTLLVLGHFRGEEGLLTLVRCRSFLLSAA